MSRKAKCQISDLSFSHLSSIENHSDSENMQIVETLIHCETDNSVTIDTPTTLVNIPEQIVDTTNNTSSFVVYQESNTQYSVKSLEDKEVDEFLELKSKEMRRNEIRQRNRKKKLQAQEMLSTSQDTTSIDQ